MLRALSKRRRIHDPRLNCPVFQDLCLPSKDQDGRLSETNLGTPIRSHGYIDHSSFLEAIGEEMMRVDDCLTGVARTLAESSVTYLPFRK